MLSLEQLVQDCFSVLAVYPGTNNMWVPAPQRVGERGMVCSASCKESPNIFVKDYYGSVLVSKMYLYYGSLILQRD